MTDWATHNIHDHLVDDISGGLRIGAGDREGDDTGRGLARDAHLELFDAHLGADLVDDTVALEKLYHIVRKHLGCIEAEYSEFEFELSFCARTYMLEVAVY